MNETTSNQERFKNYLRKISSGEHTSRGLTRKESADALELILREEPSPIQIGAFMIAHRIRRPEPQELAGMIDTYLNLGPKIYSGNQQPQPICFGMPFDGRNRTSPIYPLTTLLLLDVKQPVILQGGGRCPVKHGVTTKELFKALGLDLENLHIKKVQEGFLENGFALIYQPDHFPLAETLIKYREDLGKRPPIASMELIWSAHKGSHLIISGFVHPPTADRHIKALQLLEEDDLILIQGLEGGVDISTSRKTKATTVKNNLKSTILINPIEYALNAKDIEFQTIKEWASQSKEALEGHGPLYKVLIWNAGVYFWLAGITNDISEGIEIAKASIHSGSAKKTLSKLIAWRDR